MAGCTRENPNQIREDRVLVRRILDGDEAAFEQLFADYFDGLYRYALTHLDFDEALAAEIVQSTLCIALEKLDSYRGDSALFTWLCGCCRFEISAWYRRRKRAPVQLGLVEDQPEIRVVLNSLACGRTGPDEELRQKEVKRMVHLALDHLPPRYGRALEWKYFDGLSVNEIATQLGVSPKAAESVLSRAREAFRIGFAALSGGAGHPRLRLAAARRMAS